MLDTIGRKNSIGVSDSSSQILIKLAGNSPTIKLKILAVFSGVFCSSKGCL